MKIQFQDFNFRDATLYKIALANQIIGIYQAQGYTLTLRQLYYQMVARDMIPNTVQSYKNLGKTVGNGRLAGLIDWDAIEDRLRELVAVPHWRKPRDIVHAAAEAFRIDKWKNQPNRVEIWVEKDALSGVLEPVAERHDVDFFAARGYPSLSEMYSAGKRYAEYARLGQAVHILHLGDHDPSGIDMTRDIIDRVEMFAGQFIDVNRLALNWDQIELYNPPSQPGKTTDSRYDSYFYAFGHESWELDALEPSVLESIVEPVILELRDDVEWDLDVERENEFRTQLARAAENWGPIVEYLEEKE